MCIRDRWYPGHMTKAKRQMQEDIKLIDLIIELVDSRVPLASRNPDIDELGKNKARLILLNKSDLGDERQNEAWKAYFQGNGFYVEMCIRDREGIDLARRTGEALMDVKFDICFTSPLTRARQTARLVLGGRDIPVIPDKRIQERCV